MSQKQSRFFMDALTFIAQLSSSAAWPIAALVIVMVLRKPLSDLLLDVRRLKWRGLEAEFGKDLEHARELIDHEARIDHAPITSERSADKNRDLLLRLADLSPRSVVLEAWREVEASAGRAFQRPSPSMNLQRGLSGAIAGQTLLDHGLIDNAEFQVFTILRNLRNRAAHEDKFELAKDDAVEYALMARWLAQALDRPARHEE